MPTFVFRFARMPCGKCALEIGRHCRSPQVRSRRTANVGGLAFADRGKTSTHRINHKRSNHDYMSFEYREVLLGNVLPAYKERSIYYLWFSNKVSKRKQANIIPWKSCVKCNEKQFGTFTHHYSLDQNNTNDIMVKTFNSKLGNSCSHHPTWSK